MFSENVYIVSFILFLVFEVLVQTHFRSKYRARGKCIIDIRNLILTKNRFQKEYDDYEHDVSLWFSKHDKTIRDIERRKYPL